MSITSSVSTNGPCDKDKFKQIYELYKDMMYYIAKECLDNEALAEDAVQIGMFNISKNIDKVVYAVDSTETRTFVLVVARNAALNMMKSERANRTYAMDDARNVRDNCTDVIEQVAHSADWEFLKKCIEELDVIYSDVLTMKYVIGYSNDEISKFLNIPRKTVDTRVYRALKKLKGKVQSYYEKEHF